MKKNKLILAAIISTLLFSSCNNFIDSYEYGKVSGTLTISGAIPEEYAKILSQNTDLSKTTAGRAAFPSRPDLTSSSYTKKIIAVNQKKTSETVEAEFDQDTGAFTVNNLRFGVPYKIKANITSGTREIFSGESKSFTLTSTNSVIPDICVELDPVQSQNGTGAVKLSVTTNTIEIKKIRATVFTNVDRWTTNGAPDNFEVEASNGQNGFVTEVIDVNDIPSGAYIIRFDFLSENVNSVPRYTTYQNINVFDGLITNRWSGNDECIDSSETRTRLYVTGELCEKFGIIKDFYIGGKNASDTNSGSKNAPLETIERAFSRMDDSNADYTITISTDITKSTVIDFTQISARSIIIRGAEEKDIKLSADGNGTNLIFNTPYNIQITIEKLTITGGYSDIGGGVRIIGSSNIVFGKDCVVTGNKAENEGAGVYICGNSSEVYPTLTIQAGAKITDNHNFIAKGNAGLDAVGLGVYAENYAKVVMTGGEISGNSAVKVGGNMGHVQGGGVYVCSNGSFEMSGGKIYDNEVTVHEASGAGGGAAYVDSTGNFKISGSAVIPYGITTTDGTEKGEGKNDIMLQNIKDSGTWKQATIQVGTLTGNGTVATITTQTWRRGSPILSGSGLTDAIVERFELSDSDWEKNITDSSSKVRIDSPIYVASTGTDSTRKICSAAPSSGATGTKSKPFAKIADALAVLDDTNVSATITIDGNVTGAQTISGSIKAKDLTIKGYIPSGQTSSAAKLNGGFTSSNMGTTLATNASLPVTIQNLTITGGYADNGGGLYVGAGAVKLGTGAVVTGNKASTNGGGVYIASGASLFMYSSAIVGDTITATATSDTLTTSGDTGCANAAGTSGGGIYNLGNLYLGYTAWSGTSGTKATGTDAFTGGVRRNYAKATGSQGGGIYSTGTMYIAGGDISYNCNENNGGGIYAGGSINEITGAVTMTSNKATAGGGAITVASSKTLNISGAANFTSNNSNNGGAIINNGTLKITANAIFEKNNGSNAGGAIYNAGTLTMTSGTIGTSGKPNTTGATGGAVYHVGTSFSISSSATVYAGGLKSNDVYVASGKTISPDSNSWSGSLTMTPQTYSIESKYIVGSYVLKHYASISVTHQIVSGKNIKWITTSTGYIEKGVRVSATDAVTELETLASDSKIAITGSLSADQITAINAAMRTRYTSDNTTRFALDLTGVTGLTTIPKGDYINGDYTVFYNCKALSSIALPTTVTSLGESAFIGCNNLASITGLTNVSTIGSNCFWNCAITSFDFTQTKVSGDLSAYDNVFQGCTKLTSITIPKNITKLGANFFSGCSGLVSVTFETGSQIPEIPTSLFSGCTSLNTINNLPSTITKICSNAFTRTAFTTFTVPSNVTEIEGSAFASTNSLAELVVPTSVETIGSLIFSRTTKTKAVKYKGTASQWNAITKDTNWDKDETGTYGISRATVTYNN